MSLSQEDLAVARKMEELAWRAIRKVDPGWARQHFSEYNSILYLPDIRVREAVLESKRVIRYESLEARDLVPDFFLLRNMARARLKLPPAVDILEGMRSRRWKRAEISVRRAGVEPT